MIVADERDGEEKIFGELQGCGARFVREDFLERGADDGPRGRAELRHRGREGTAHRGIERELHACAVETVCACGPGLMNEALRVPGVSNAWTQPIKNRIDMLTTGIRTPVGVKIFGADIQQIEKIARSELIRQPTNCVKPPTIGQLIRSRTARLAK